MAVLDLINNTNTTPFGATITNLQGMIDNNVFDQSNFLNEYNQDLDNYSGNVDTYVTGMQDANNSTARRTLKGNAQSVLNSLANRRMLNSDVASDTLSKSLGTIASETAARNVEAKAQGAQYKLAIPEMKRNALNTQAQTSTQMLLPYEMLLKALEIDQYKYAPAL